MKKITKEYPEETRVMPAFTETLYESEDGEIFRDETSALRHDLRIKKKDLFDRAPNFDCDYDYIDRLQFVFIENEADYKILVEADKIRPQTHIFPCWVAYKVNPYDQWAYEYLFIDVDEFVGSVKDFLFRLEHGGKNNEQE